MKSTGVVRRIDELGRFVLPAEIRKTLGINLGDQLEIHIDKDAVILKKYSPNCMFCGGTQEIKSFADQRICQSCLDAIKKL